MEEDGGGGGPPRRLHYKRARPVQELVLEAQEKAGYRAGAAVRITGLQNAAHLNGCLGKLLYSVPETGRWQVTLEDGPEKGQNKALKVNNLEPLDAPKWTLPATARPLQVGDRVQLLGLETRPELNGQTGLLLEKLPTRWKVEMDGSPGDLKLMKEKHLRLLEEGSRAMPGAPAPGRKRPQYWIAGSWDNWTPCQMDWDEERHCHMVNVVLGSRGFENFLLLVDGDWKQCLHPDKANACPHMDYALCGPDASGEQVKSWAIGRHSNDQGGAGARYEVRLVLTDDFRAGQVDWLRLFSPQESAAAAAPAAAAAAKASPVAVPKAKAKAPLPSLQEVLKQVFEEVKGKGGQLYEADPAWECVGGADKGGILVRQGEELASAQTKDRLATGAIVKQRDLKGERLHYEIIRGKGPTSGWVSIKFKEKDGKVKDLMVLTDKAPRPALKDKDLQGLQDKLAKAKIRTLTELEMVLRDLGADAVNVRLKAAGQRALLPAALQRLKACAEAASQGAGGLPAPELPVQKFEVVHDIAMIRAEPATNAQALARKLKGETITGVEETFDGWVCLENEGGWVVRDMKGKLGVGKLLSPLGKAPLLACGEIGDQPGPKRFEVVYKTVAVRDKPAVSGKILGARSLGEIVEADTQSYHGWLRLSEGEGWMLSWKEDLGQLLKPAPPAPKGPRIVSAPVLPDEDMDEVARWAQTEVARRKGRPPPPDPKEEARKQQEAEEQQRRREEAARKAEEEERQRQRDAETSRRVMAEARQSGADKEEELKRKKKEEIRRLEEARKEEEKRIAEDRARRVEEEARKAEERRLEVERRKEQQEAKRREEAARREEEEARRREGAARRQEEEVERRRRKEEEEEQLRKQQQEAAELKRREEELAKEKKPAEVADGGGVPEHGELLERFREAVVAGDNALIKVTRDAAKKGGVPVKEIGRVYAAAQEQRAAAG